MPARRAKARDTAAQVTTAPRLPEVEEKRLNMEIAAMAFTQQKRESAILLSPKLWPRESVINGSPFDAE
jgi:hypothetical protein